MRALQYRLVRVTAGQSPCIAHDSDPTGEALFERGDTEDEIMDRAGLRGWDLVCVTDDIIDHRPTRTLYFKRIAK